jgi:hypothetical protein
MSLSTIIFCHRAYHPMEIFSKVTGILEPLGYKCNALSMPSVARSSAVTSLDEGIAEIRGTVLKELDAGRDVMMHAHSWAGVPVCSALEGFSGAERQKECKAGTIVKLTFVSSFVLQEGVSLQDFIGGYKDTWIKFEVRPASYISISRSLLIIYPRTETFGLIHLFQCCNLTTISHQKKPKNGRPNSSLNPSPHSRTKPGLRRGGRSRRHILSAKMIAQSLFKGKMQ